jgi:hypothetical protein
VKRFAAILLTFYSLSMLSYGSLEMVHDLLHWMATHYDSEIHNHEHDHHHTYHDHEHQHDDHHYHLSENESSGSSELPSLIHFFLYYQQRPSFSFITSYAGSLGRSDIFRLEHVDSNPITPPPQTL